MIGMVESPRAWWMAQGMARASGVHLARAVVEGWLTRAELTRLVDRCAHCSQSCTCLAWLAEPRHESPPDFCGIGAEITALSPDR